MGIWNDATPRQHPQLLLQNSSPQLIVPDSSDERAKATPSKYGTTATASETELFQPRRALASGARRTRRTRENEIGKARHQVRLAEGDEARTPAAPLGWTEGTSEGTVAEDVGAGGVVDVVQRRPLARSATPKPLPRTIARVYT